MKQCTQIGQCMNTRSVSESLSTLPAPVLLAFFPISWLLALVYPLFFLSRILSLQFLLNI